MRIELSPEILFFFCFCFFLFQFGCCFVVFFFSNPSVDWVFHKSGSQRHAVLSLFRGCGTRGEKVAGHEQFSKSANSKTHTHGTRTTNACVRICVIASAAIRRSILVQPSVAIGPCHFEMRRRHQQPTCGAFQVQPHPHSPSNEIQNKAGSFQSVIPSLLASPATSHPKWSQWISVILAYLGFVWFQFFMSAFFWFFYLFSFFKW